MLWLHFYTVKFLIVNYYVVGCLNLMSKYLRFGTLWLRLFGVLSVENWLFYDQNISDFENIKYFWPFSNAHNFACACRVDPFSKKDWYDVKAPSMFAVRQIGKTLVTRTQGTSKFKVYYMPLFWCCCVGRYLRKKARKTWLVCLSRCLH